jgi:hypothetical protein
MKTTFKYLITNDCFKANLLTLNFDKTYFKQFLTKNSDAMDMCIDCGNNQIAKSNNTNFLGLIMDNKLQETLRMIYFSYFHTVTAYGIIFWGNSPHSINIFRLQKRVTRIITNSRSTDSCRELFKKLKILPLKSQYMYISSLVICG